MAEPETSTDNLQQNSQKLKKNGKIYFLLFLATIPGACFASVRLHVIKIGAAEAFRCEIRSLENSSWQPQEIQGISQARGAHRECFIYNYDYGTLTNLTFEDAKKFVDKEDANRMRMCSKFVAIRNREIFTETYAKEFASYCEGVSQEITYDIVAVLSYIMGCLFFAPFADIFGRKRILAVGCDLALLSIILKIIFLHFTSEQVGEMLLNFAYPAMKYPTQALVLETTDNTLRPLAFVLIFAGTYIPPLIAGVMPPVSVYWKCLHLIAFCPVFILPLLTWYFPESTLWFATIKDDALAQIVAETINDPPKHNDLFLLLRNGRGRFKKIKTLFKEFCKINRAEFIVMNVLTVFVGFLSFYSYSKHKLMYNYLEDDGIRFLSACSGLLAIVAAIPCVYFMNAVKFSVALLFLGTGIIYLFLAHFCSNMAQNFYVIVVLISCTEMTTNALQILYEFYLQQIFPTSHRCVCTAYCGAAMSVGLLLVIIVREVNEMVSHIISSCLCLLGCILSVLLIKNLRRTKPLVLNFSDVELKIPNKCLNVCCVK